MALPLLRLALLFCALAHAGERRAWLWCEADANWASLNSEKGAAAMIRRAKDAGITDVIVDVNPITGEVLYPSELAPRRLEWNGVKLADAGYDRLAVLLKEGHARGLRVHASLDVFSFANKFAKPPRGVLLQKPEWQTVLLTSAGLRGTMEVDQGPGGYSGFANPIIPAVQDYELSIIRELAARYPALDGLVLDRMRYDEVRSDFSELSRREFERQVGFISRWPEDILTPKDGAVDPGPFFKRWVAWRAANIKSFLARARAAAKKDNPKLEVNVYVGSWHPLYYDAGVNWASDDFKPDYPWSSPDYAKAGYAKLVDHLLVGAYYPDVTAAELRAKNEQALDRLTGKKVPKADYYSVEGALGLAKKAVAGAAPFYGGLLLTDYQGRPEKLRHAVKMCLEKSDGVMLFDLIYVEKGNLWAQLKAALKR